MRGSAYFSSTNRHILQPDQFRNSALLSSVALLHMSDIIIICSLSVAIICFCIVFASSNVILRWSCIVSRKVRPPRDVRSSRAFCEWAKRRICSRTSQYSSLLDKEEWRWRRLEERVCLCGEVRNVNGNATFGVLLDRFEYWECIAIGTLMAV